MKLKEIINFLDDFLRIGDFRDSSSNGLQVEGKEEVERIGFAVDASIETFKKAVEKDVDLIVAHHGLIWGSLRNVVGSLRRRLSFLLKNEISLYVAHLPLDAHKEVGNNIQILKMLNGEIKGFFAEVDGSEIGIYGQIERTGLKTLAQNLENLLSTKSKILDFGKKEVEVVSVVSGSGDFAIESASEVSDCLITGEQRYSAYHLAKELEFNVIYLGHYATELPGIRALMEVVEKRFREVDCLLIEYPVPY